MDVHVQLRSLGQALGPQIFDDADNLRAALDDFLDEGGVSPGEIRLIVDAVRYGALDRLRSAVGLGGDPSAALTDAARLLARERGTADIDSARWACAMVGYAVGLVPEAEVSRRHTVQVDAPPAGTGLAGGRSPHPAAAAAGQRGHGRPESVRVLVIEDHPMFRSALVSLVESMDGWSTVGAYGDAEAAFVAADHADIVVLDLGLPGIDGVEAIRRIRTTTPHVPVLVLTLSEEPDILAAAIRAGANGYLLKDSEPEDIERALRGVARGQAVFSEQVATVVLGQASLASRMAGWHQELHALTEEELAVLGLIARGRSTVEIAEQLATSAAEAGDLESAVLAKLGVDSREEAAVRVRDAGLGPTA
jgi:DNA-binding NarL/FixJ family response regulator